MRLDRQLGVSNPFPVPAEPSHVVVESLPDGVRRASFAIGLPRSFLLGEPVARQGLRLGVGEDRAAIGVAGIVGGANGTIVLLTIRRAEPGNPGTHLVP